MICSYLDIEPFVISLQPVRFWKNFANAYSINNSISLGINFGSGIKICLWR